MHPIPKPAIFFNRATRHGVSDALEIARAKKIMKFLASHPNGKRWSNRYVWARNRSYGSIKHLDIEFGVLKTIHTFVLKTISELEFIHAMNRVFYMLRDGTYFHPHERKDIP